MLEGPSSRPFQQDITTHAADGNLRLVKLGRREARPAQRDEDEPAACGIAAAMQSQTQPARLRSLVRSPNRSPLVEPADEWVQHHTGISGMHTTFD